MKTDLRLLHIEDAEDDALLIQHELRRGGWNPISTRVETVSDLRQSLGTGAWDLIISDFGLPNFDAPSALSVVQEFALDVPFIIVSGTIPDQAVGSAMKAGAHDFVSKNNLQRLVPAVRRELGEARSRRARRYAEARFRTLVRSLDGAVVTLGRDLVVDGVFGRRVLTGQADASAYVGKGLGALLNAEADAEVTSRLADGCRRALTGEDVVQELTRGAPSAAQHVQVTLSPMVEENGSVSGIVCYVRDVSDERALHAQTVTSDRMATIGSIAAGVAHEINNPLAALLSNLDVLSLDILKIPVSDVPTAKTMLDIREALSDARAAAAMVRTISRDLRTFSRQVEDQPSPISASQVLDASIRMAWSQLQYRARLTRDYRPVPPVLAVEASLGQVFLNLLINAAQALPEGQTDDHEVHVCIRPDATRAHVIIEVSDTGQGIPEAVKARLFTPFFTTKPPGVGTGLGLSICQRIITSFGGTIEVESVEGEGATFRVILPTATPPTVTASVATSAPRQLLARARLLVVDDEAMVRRSIARTLREAHDVVTVDCVSRALELVAAGHRFDAILCDLVMPGLTGIDLYHSLVDLDPSQAQHTIFLLGEGSTEASRQFLASIENPRLEKPFEAGRLEAVVAQTLA